MPDVNFVVLCVLTGSLFIAGFFMLALATAVAGMSIATAVVRISVVIAFIASWAIWSEEPSANQLVGLSTAAAAFFLRAITHLSGPFVFPANNILLVIGSTLLSVLFWKKRLTATNWIGLTLAAAALILLNF